jgi:hypothetical protein
MSNKQHCFKKNQHSIKNNNVFIGLLFSVVILPWPHGGEVVWQYLVFSSIIFSLGAIYVLNSINDSVNCYLPLKIVKLPLIFLSAWLLFQLFQVIPLPRYLISMLSNVAEQKLNTNNWQTISIAPNITLIELIKHGSYVITFVLTLLLLNTKQRILIFTNTLFFSSAIIALYSLLNYYTQGEFSLIKSIPPWTKEWEIAVHGTFSYQNHYASFLTLTIPLGYGLIYSNMKKNSGNKTNLNNLAKIINFVMSVNGFYLVCILVMIIALFKTASRGGNTIFIISIVITFLCVIFQQKNSKKEKVKKIGLGVISIVATIIIIMTTGLTDSLTKRLYTQGYKPSGRDLMHQTALAIIKESPLAGTGAGTYPVLQHIYKDHVLGSSAMSKRAHNDYLELLSNQGVVGFSLLTVAITWLYLLLLKGLKKNSNLYSLLISCFCSVTAILFHSLADFNFHLPTNAIYFYMILALGIKISQLSLCD